MSNGRRNTSVGRSTVPVAGPSCTRVPLERSQRAPRPLVSQSAATVREISQQPSRAARPLLPPSLPSTLPLLNPLNNPLNRPTPQFTPVRTQYDIPGTRLEPPRHPSDVELETPYYETEPVRQWRQKSQSSLSPLVRKFSKYALVVILDIVIAVTAVAIMCFVSLLTGHLILRMTMPSATDPTLPKSAYDAPIVPTIEAGILGGTILAIPFAILVKVLFPPRDSTIIPQSVTQNEDFVNFDQAEGSLDARQIAADSALGGVRETPLTRMQCHKIAALVFCTCVGAAGGPIGAVALKSCFAGKAAWATVPDRMQRESTVWLLDPGHAARAGALGGAIIGPGVFLLGWIGWKIWQRFFVHEAVESGPYGIRGVERTWYY
ncbi:hypothetical protein HGRIS_010857 [Hohenbuehelia grisea]|uniref:Uncharacterized protein n=1 Tax=Hohenbuehelia grisea TaxID=104357 RepID=A0ABR3IY75_9AGAR